MTELVVPPTPPEAALVFGARLEQAEHFVRILADTGISRGLIGPREAPRLWDRHVLNCGVVHLLIPATNSTQQVIDVGSGAGLPGLALAIARPDLELHLVEPLARRTAWLTEATRELDLDNVTVHTARAEAMWGRLVVPWVTARAVTGIVQLAEWTLPLLSGGGSLLALKGSKAQDELTDHLGTLKRLGVTDAAIEEAGSDVLAEPTTVVRLSVAQAVDGRTFRRKSPSSAGSARRRSDRPRRPLRGGPGPAASADHGRHTDHSVGDQPGEDAGSGLRADAGDRGADTPRLSGRQAGLDSGAEPVAGDIGDGGLGTTRRRGRRDGGSGLGRSRGDGP